MPVEEKKRLKAEYDKKRRTEKADELKAQKKAAYALWVHCTETKNARSEKRTCRGTSSIAANQNIRNGRKNTTGNLRVAEYGEYAESYELLSELVKQIKPQMPDRFERYAQAGRQQWNPINQQRRRHARTIRIDSE